MQTYITKGQLKVAEQLEQFIRQDALPGTGVDETVFWAGFETILQDLMPANQALLATRDALQSKIDEYSQGYASPSLEEYKTFLRQIGYLVPQPEDFAITTDDVDPEIASMAGPQLVVPINNARYALNAANARWGSLYDAFYGTDIIAEDEGAEKGASYNPVRGQRVIDKAREWLDTLAPLANGSHKGSTYYAVSSGDLIVSLSDGSTTKLADPGQWAGYRGDIASPEAILIKHNGLHFELQFDPSHPVGKADPAMLKDILMESALTTIMDCEDSVAAVDAEDKTLVYQNWLGLMKGNLSASMNKGGKTLTRTMNPDRQYQASDGSTLTLAGRSLMFVRNVGHLMTSDAILFNDHPIPEGIMDGMITALIAKHDLLGNSQFRNSRNGSVYIVKPKMHGPEEVAFANTLFDRIEQALDLKPNTLKMGIMDEERRTSVNLKACIYEARGRAVFINTGFLDRTGDEIHTSMLQGAFAPKADLKTMPWISAYETANVTIGLGAGMSGKAQIGKGMWPIPDKMSDMMTAKLGHPQSGANTAWVPSPTAATLHALHYHQCDVFSLHGPLKASDFDGLDDILTVPLMPSDLNLTQQDIQREVDNNVQGILGYVVRWVHQGVGCSKVPDINDVGLMEDRATLRISSQHICNWLAHGVIDDALVDASMRRMASLVDGQNAGDKDYISMCPDLDNSIAFQAARELIFAGKEQPNGYTEPVLHAKRREMKARLNG